VETPAGAQAQVDWADFTDIDVGDGPQKLYAFVMVESIRTTASPIDISPEKRPLPPR
jgi:hypothetical protein